MNLGTDYTDFTEKDSVNTYAKTVLIHVIRAFIFFITLHKLEYPEEKCISWWSSRYGNNSDGCHCSR